MNTFSTRVIALATVVGSLALGACATAPRSVQGKADIEQDASVALARVQRTNPSVMDILQQADGYAVFPRVGKGGAGVGGAYGKGVLYERGVAVGYCDLSQATIGLQLGGQSYTELIAFNTRDALEAFKEGHFRFDAQATAVALKSGAGANAQYKNGVAVFTTDEAGLMLEASVGGQKFSYQRK